MCADVWSIPFPCVCFFSENEVEVRPEPKFCVSLLTSTLPKTTTSSPPPPDDSGGGVMSYLKDYLNGLVSGWVVSDWPLIISMNSRIHQQYNVRVYQ